MSSILILDDVADSGNMVKRILERKGHEAVAFTEEEEALDHAKAARPDVAVLDIKLKKMSGVEVLEELLKRSPQTRVIMLTGYPTMDTAGEAERLGAFEYLVKPIDKTELEEAVERALERGAEG